MNQDIPLFVFINSKKALEIMTRGKGPTRKGFAINVTAARDAYRCFEIEREGVVREEHNSADALNKLEHNNVLHKLMENNKDETLVQEWNVRTKTSTV